MSVPPLRRASYTLHLASIANHSREGAEPFPVACLRLVHLLDTVLDLFESEPRFQHFTLDGSAILLEDYLALRPENFERIERAVQEGRLLVGPWYVRPELASASAEMLIRNLLIGLRTARVFGEPMPVGYLPDAHALPGVLPQLLKGFGLNTLITTQQAPFVPIECRWQGDDGTQVLVCRLITSPDAPLAALRAAAAPYSDSGNILLLVPWRDATFLRQIPAAQAQLHDDVFHSSPAAYAKAVEAHARVHDLPVVRDFPPLPAEGHSGSAEGERAETLLRTVIEPLAVWREYEPQPDSERPYLRRPQMLIRKLWQLVLENQNSLSVHRPPEAAVLQDIEARYRHFFQVAGQLADVPFSIAQIVTVSDSMFEIRAAKLPEESAGLIVRGCNVGDSPVSVRIKPWRRFAACQVVTLDEIPTGGTMGLDDSGAIRFNAAPHRLLTFWFHD